MRSSIALIAMLVIAGAATAQPFDPLQVRGWAAACTSCHSNQAQPDPAMAPLVGVECDSMFAILLDFKSGRRPATVMQQLARGYDDEQLRAIAAYFSRLKQP